MEKLFKNIISAQVQKKGEEKHPKKKTRSWRGEE